MTFKHPMVNAIGVDAFQKGLEELPIYYAPKYRDNYKPIGMWFIWYCKEMPNDPKKVQNHVNEAYNLWVCGETAENAVKKVMGIE